MGSHESLSHEPFLDALRAAGYRLTPQRRAVCRALAASEEHPTAQSLYAALLEQHPSLSLTTVYNTLDTLVRLGAIHALGAVGDERTHYEPNTAPHVNVACISCHRIVDYDSRALHQLDAELRQRFSDRKLLGSRLVYYTECVAGESPDYCPYRGACCGTPSSCAYVTGGCDHLAGPESHPRAEGRSTPKSATEEEPHE
jgi:Fur family peroxide stress response transcriptional regulator